MKASTRMIHNALPSVLSALSRPMHTFRLYGKDIPFSHFTIPTTTDDAEIIQTLNDGNLIFGVFHKDFSTLIDPVNGDFLLPYDVRKEKQTQFITKLLESEPSTDHPPSPAYTTHQWKRLLSDPNNVCIDSYKKAHRAISGLGTQEYLPREGEWAAAELLANFRDTTDIARS